jgi:ornithine carbamoyltransferase
VPVWNGLSDEWHPTQTLCDGLTMREHTVKHDTDIAFAFLGDARRQHGQLVAGHRRDDGHGRAHGGPAGAWNHDERDQGGAADRGGDPVARITQTDNVEEGVRGVDFLYTGRVAVMGEPKQAWNERIELLRAYQINMDMVRATGNPVVKVMHCLPAFHDRRTKVGEEIYEHTGLAALEITDEVFESPYSIVFDQAENRMHTIKAVMVATLGS